MNKWLKIGFSILLFISTNAIAQLTYNNLGFEKGTFEGWECSSGTRTTTNVFQMNPVGPPNTRHAIIGPSQKNELDPFGHFPVLCPNGSNYSIKLGSSDIPRYVERISRTLKNIPSNFSLVFNYAIVLDANAVHGVNDQPVFNVQIFDADNNTALTCPSFNFVASLGLPGFTTSDILSIKPMGDPTYPVYRNWTTAMIDLKDYAGKNIRIEFTTADCNGSIHFAYAYIDIDEKLSLKPITGTIFCKGQDSTTLVAPDGFLDYTWFKGGDLRSPVASGQNFRVPAVDKDKYAVTLTGYSGFSCDDILYANLEELPDVFKLNVKPKIFGCPGSSVNLTSPNVTAGSSPLTYSYYLKNELGLVYLPNPNAVQSSGTYYIRGTNAGGCTDILPVEVIIGSPDITVINPPAVQFPAKVDLNNTFSQDVGVSYKFFSDADGTIPIDSKVSASGTYYIQATSGTSGCTSIVPVKVVIDPPPPYTIIAPNVFTPNGDGINDNFVIKLEGYISFGSLNVFNRYGQKVFSTRSIADYWNGDTGSQQLPAGTYYWIFEGTDEYYHIKVIKSSSITIVR
jgi:gliding motility-associated-like protein